HFDIDWDPPTRRLRGVVLLPVLGDHYGRVLESGELHLERGKADALVARYYDHVAPLSPETTVEIWAIAGRRGTNVDDARVLLPDGRWHNVLPAAGHEGGHLPAVTDLRGDFPVGVLERL